jgi:hypothetical protein
VVWGCFFFWKFGGFVGLAFVPNLQNIKNPKWISFVVLFYSFIEQNLTKDKSLKFFPH